MQKISNGFMTRSIESILVYNLGFDGHILAGVADVLVHILRVIHSWITYELDLSTEKKRQDWNVYFWMRDKNSSISNSLIHILFYF